MLFKKLGYYRIVSFTMITLLFSGIFYISKITAGTLSDDNLIHLAFTKIQNTAAGEDIALIICNQKDDHKVRVDSPAKSWMINSLKWSPDGKKIAFIEFNGESQVLWIVGAEGTVRKQIAKGTHQLSYRWSPSGHQLAYLMDGGLFVTDSGFKSFLPLAFKEVREYQWSPDGTKIMFDTNHSEIYIFDTRTRKQILKLNEWNAGFSWAPDGKRLAIAGKNQKDDRYGIYIMKPEGTARYWIAGSDKQMRYPRWSPDGQWISFESGPHTDELKVAKVDGSRTISLIKGLYLKDYSWSPTGKYLALRAAKDRNVPTNLFVVNIDDFKLAQVSSSGYSSPVWSPNGAMLLFSSIPVFTARVGDIPTVSLYLMNVADDGKFIPHQLAKYHLYHESHFFFDWVDPDRVLFISEKIVNKPQINIINTDGSQLKELIEVTGSISHLGIGRPVNKN